MSGADSICGEFLSAGLEVCICTTTARLIIDVTVCSVMHGVPFTSL